MKKEFVLKRFKEKAKYPLTFEEILAIIPTDGKKKYSEKEIAAILKLLIKDGSLVKTRKDRYALAEQLNLVSGIVRKNKKGFGFLTTENPNQDDIFISAMDLNGALNDDTVIARIVRPESVNRQNGTLQKAEGEVIRILERARTTFVGTLSRQSGYGFVVPDDKLFDGDIFIPPEALGGAQNDDKVLVEITKWPEKKRNAEGIVTKVIGHAGDAGMDVLSIVYKHDLVIDFSKKALDMARRIPQTVSEKKASSRVDLRHQLFITIDGVDSKDLDDAVSVEHLEGGNYLLTVAIADVGEYVFEDSPLDVDAFKRGTSVYLVDRVLPMLPEELSNGICSLNPGEDRLVLACTMEIDPNGRVLSSNIFESVINSAYRMTYDDVNAILDGDTELCLKYAQILDMIRDLDDLRGILWSRREKYGALDFQTRESYVTLDEDGFPVDVGWRNRGRAEKIIEQCMIVCNEVVAEHYFWLRIPFIYRVHEKPLGEKLDAARDYLEALGYTLPPLNDKVDAQALQKVLNKVEGTKDVYTVNHVLLRAMRQAFYSTSPLGHFGLASKYYTHFTSPIRRYSDLSIHRVIKEAIYHHQSLSKKRCSVLAESMSKYAKQASITERVAVEAERDSMALKKVQFMMDKEGDVFEATVVSVVAFGLFIQLDNSIEGLVHISSMVEDFFHFNSVTLQLIGEHSKKVYELGMRVQVRLIRVNIDDVQLDFELV